MKPKKSTSYADRFRSADLAKIHIAKKQLGLDDDTYREMLKGITGKTSAGDLSACERADVLNHLKMTGFLEKRKGRPDSAMTGEDSRARQLKKIEALLTIGDKSWAYADGIAKRICKVDKMAWVKTRDLYKIITALRKFAQKEGWDLQD
jgi:phage gp16-like protein